MDRRNRVPVEEGSFNRSISGYEARKIEGLALRFGRLVRQLVELDDNSFGLAMEMMPRTDFGDMSLRDRKLAEAVKELRNNTLGKEEHGMRYRERPVVQDSLDEVRDRRVARVQRSLELRRNRKPDPLQIELARIHLDLRQRITEMVNGHFERVPVTDGELDDMSDPY